MAGIPGEGLSQKTNILTLIANLRRNGRNPWRGIVTNHSAWRHIDGAVVGMAGIPGEGLSLGDRQRDLNPRRQVGMAGIPGEGLSRVAVGMDVSVGGMVGMAGIPGEGLSRGR
jgi:hypothetical protein